MKQITVMDSSGQVGRIEFSMKMQPWNWLRVHLSTALLMMLTAAVVVGIQCIPNLSGQYVRAHCDCRLADYFGWPFAFYRIHYAPVLHETSNGTLYDTKGEPNAYDWVWTFGFMLNLALSLWTIWFIKYLSEYAIRRCEAQEG